jgi:predicted enzyme related to lactoylglutathione lyase
MIAVSISIDVPDLALAVNFYTQALGCEIVREPQDRSAVVAADQTHIHLLVCEAATKPVSASDNIVRNYDRHWTPVHLDFLSNDVPELVSKIIEFGGQHEGGEKADWGEIAHCVDPFGNGFCIIRE